jgi:mono/diheme cytochrome c family protein/uncharacterized membrane protein
LLGLRRAGPVVALVLAGVAVAMQGAIGHVGAVGGGTGAGLIASEALHLLTAGAWLGSLLPLMLCLRRLSASEAAELCLNFSPVGIGCVLVLATSGLAQGMELVGSVPALVGTAYGRIALLKIALFVVALGFASRNRLTLTERLVDADPEAARRQLVRSIGAETVIGLAIVMAAGFLASTTPGAHEQPDWPFPWRPSLAAMAEPELRREVVVSLGLVGAALVGVAVSLVRRRGRVVLVLLAVGMIVWRAPGFGLLVVEATPTSFYASPTGFNATSIVHGQALYAAQCADCHGAGGQGDGPAAGRVQPADLTAGHLWEHSDGDPFWWIGHGMRDPEGGRAMPGFAATLSASDRWDLIDYMRANNAGTALRMESGRSLPPAMPVRCAGSSVSQLSDLRGKVVLVITTAASHVSGPPVIPEQDGFPVVALYLSGRRPTNGCVAETPDARAAFAITAGLSPSGSPAPGYVVDPDGWLRAILPKDQVSDHPERLVATIRAICDHLDGAVATEEHVHHH